MGVPIHPQVITHCENMITVIRQGVKLIKEGRAGNNPGNPRPRPGFSSIRHHIEESRQGGPVDPV